jgi:hypothetical protein
LLNKNLVYEKSPKAQKNNLAKIFYCDPA